MELKNKNVFVTGSSRGIGLAIAHKFASKGANIVLNSRGELPAGLVDEFASYGVKVVGVTGMYPKLRKRNEWSRKRLKHLAQ